jgi:hypothetical protein
MRESGFPGHNPEIKKIIQERVHLREDIRPIERQIKKLADSDEKLEDIQDQMEDDDKIHNVDLDGGDLDSLKKNGFKNDGIASYLISPISEIDWFSDHLLSCTGVVAIGKDKVTGKEISFLSHQDPGYFIDGEDDKPEIFSRELKESLEELKLRSQSDTVEVILLGGNYSNTYEKEDYQKKHYKQSIEKLRQIVHDSLGFDPKVLTGPNNKIGSETVITVETQKRKVWIERSKQPPKFDQSYMANSLSEKEEEWSEVAK